MPSNSPFVTAPTGPTSGRRPVFTQPDDTEFPDLHSNISIWGIAAQDSVFHRKAESAVALQQRAPGIWDLAAETQVELTDEPGKLRHPHGDAENQINLSQSNTVAGGRLACVIVQDPQSPRHVEVFDVDAMLASTTTVTLLKTPDNNTDDVYLNGLLATPGLTRDYTLSSNTITFNPTCTLHIGDVVTVKYEA